MSDPSSRNTGNEITVLRPNERIVYDSSIHELGFQHWCITAGRSMRLVERLMSTDLGEGAHSPDHSTLATWARDENWEHRCRELWRSDPGRARERLQIDAVAGVALGLRFLVRVVAGLEEGSVKLIAAKTNAAKALLQVPRDLPALSAVTPADDITPAEELDGLSREEKEALARQGLVQREIRR